MTLQVYREMEYYLNQSWHYYFKEGDDPIEPWTIFVYELPGCMTHGANIGECFKNVKDAIESYIYGLMEDGEPIPDAYPCNQIMLETLETEVY